MKLLDYAFVLAVMLLGVSLIGHTASERANNIGMVYAICMDSHQHVSGVNEQRCGDIQDTTHTEFQCSARTSISRCWVELK